MRRGLAPHGASTNITALFRNSAALAALCSAQELKRHGPTTWPRQQAGRPEPSAPAVAKAWHGKTKTADAPPGPAGRLCGHRGATPPKQPYGTMGVGVDAVTTPCIRKFRNASNLARPSACLALHKVFARMKSTPKAKNEYHHNTGMLSVSL